MVKLQQAECHTHTHLGVGIHVYSHLSLSPVVLFSSFLPFSLFSLSCENVKGTVSNIYIFKISVKYLSIPTAFTDVECLFHNMSPSPSAFALNRKYISWSEYQFYPIRKENSSKSKPLRVHVVTLGGGSVLLTPKKGQEVSLITKSLTAPLSSNIQNVWIRHFLINPKFFLHV